MAGGLGPKSITGLLKGVFLALAGVCKFVFTLFVLPVSFSVLGLILQSQGQIPANHTVSLA